MRIENPGVIRSALTHPALIPLKRLVRDGWWALAGTRIANPSLPPQIRSMLFVCVGNICRSPFAAQLARRLLAEARLDHVHCSSAGFRAVPDNRPPDEARAAAAPFGISLEDHQPAAVSAELLESTDIVFVMEVEHLRRLRAEYPAFADRAFLLPLFGPGHRSAYESYNIADPFGNPFSAFERCYHHIEQALRGLIREIGATQYANTPAGQ